MADALEFELDAVRTDGWFERIGEGIGSFQALCEIVGERFVAFSIIVGARVTALTIDKRAPALSMVDFVVGVPEQDGELDPQRLTLGDFRRHLVGALLVDDDRPSPVPARDSQVETIQLFIGIRYLLLAPLYGYSLQTLWIGKDTARLLVLHDGVEEHMDLDAFRFKIRVLVREELDRVASPTRNTIDLSKVGEAELATARGDYTRVIALLGNWPAPLATLPRTPDGQMLGPEARAMIARGLALLGGACVELGELDQAEQVFRIGIQYASDGAPAADLCKRLGEAMFRAGRAGEAIALFRRSLAFGASRPVVLPLLAAAFADRSKYVAALACLTEAKALGVSGPSTASLWLLVEQSLGPSVARYRAAVSPDAPLS